MLYNHYEDQSQKPGFGIQMAIFLQYLCEITVFVLISAHAPIRAHSYDF